MWFSGAKKRIYLDHASATIPREEALLAMHAAESLVGNPGAIHKEGAEAKRALERARADVALQLGCKAREIVFTSGLTESVNLAILGIARRIECRGDKITTKPGLRGTHWMVSSIEHSAVLESFAEVERLGGTVTYVDPDHKGIIEPETVLRALRPETVLISIGWANNEIGVIQPLRDIARAVLQENSSTLIHSDAGQAPLYISPQVHTLGVDLLSLGSNKLYGPHGVGALYLSNRAELAAVVLGGKQERALRAGTENVALAIGFASALSHSAHDRTDEARRLRALRDAFARNLVAHIPGAVVNGDVTHALPHMLNVSIPNISSEYVTLALDHAGIAVSTKSACREGEESVSHAVAALHRNTPEEAWRSKNTLRFSLGRDTTENDLLETCSKLATISKEVHNSLTANPIAV